MLETFQSATSRDFRQRYTGSYGFYTIPLSKKRILVYLSEVGEDTAHFLDENSAKYTAKADQAVEFEFIPVKKKLFSYNDQLYLAQRRPARMWSRGVNPQNTLFLEVTKGRASTVKFELVKAAFINHDEIPALQKVKAVEEKRTNVAVVSDLFGIADGSLFLYDFRVGSIDTVARQIKVEEHMFRQEIADMVQVYQLPYQVVNNV